MAPARIDDTTLRNRLVQRTSRGLSSAVRGLVHVGCDVFDLLRRQGGAEGGHEAPATRHLTDDRRLTRGQRVEVRADVAGRTGCRQGVTPTAARALEDR